MKHILFCLLLASPMIVMAQNESKVDGTGAVVGVAGMGVAYKADKIMKDIIVKKSKSLIEYTGRGRIYTETDLDNIVSRFKKGDHAIVDIKPREEALLDRPKKQLLEKAKKFQAAGDSELAKATKDLAMTYQQPTPVDLKEFNELLDMANEHGNEEKMRRGLKKILQNELAYGHDIIGLTRIPKASVGSYKLAHNASLIGTGLAVFGMGATLISTVKSSKSSQRLDNSDRSTLSVDKDSNVKEQKQTVGVSRQ
jgi:hypothetical protein